MKTDKTISEVLVILGVSILILTAIIGIVYYLN